MNERVLFEAALEIAEPAARQAYLDQACADNPELRARVETLLQSHHAAGSFLEVPLVNPPIQKDGAEGERTIELASPANSDNSDDESISLSFLEPSLKPGSIGKLAHYEVLSEIGQGAFGIVLKAFDEKLHRLVAIKVMNPQLAATSPPRKRFLREARAAAAIRHENVVQVHSVEEQPLPYLVMEFIDGQTMQEKLDGAGPLEIAEILHIGRQIASGLAAAHATGLIHRDIKPGNILLESGPEQKVKITDFGLARAADDASMTRTGTVCGTPMYMAPEQAFGQTLDHRADLFSFGSVLYQMACGRPPFRAPTTIAVLRRVTDEAPRPLQEIIPEIPDWLVAIINKLHAKRPDERFQTAKEIAELLARCQSELQLKHEVTCIPTERVANVSVEDLMTLDETPNANHESKKIISDASTSDSAKLKQIVYGALLALMVMSPILFGRQLSSIVNKWVWPAIPTLPLTEITTGLRFDGKDDYIKVGPIDLSSPQYTLEAFVTSAKDGDNGIVALLKNGDGPPEVMELYDGYPGGQRQSGAGIIGKSPYQSVNAPLAAGSREHRAIVFDGAAMHYYVNGIWQGKRNCTAHKGLMWQMRELYIGCKANQTQFFRGQIDQLRLSKIARYDDHFTVASTLTADESTLALYQFDEGRGDVLHDSSGNNHDGKIVGAKWTKSQSQPLSVPAAVGRSDWPVDAPSPAIAPFNAEQAKQHQQAWAAYLNVPVEYINSIGIKFRLIPPGEFTMGSTPEQIAAALPTAGDDALWQECIKSEGPQHQVVLTEPFFLATNEVTQSQFKRVSQKNPSSFSEEGQWAEYVEGIDTSLFPVEGVSWNNAVDFCVRLTDMESAAYRLPTEAEWEYACRAGSTTEYFTGDTPADLAQMCWFADNSNDRTHAVGELQQNAFGMHDMHGNVWEWVADAWNPTLYSTEANYATVNPFNRPSEDSQRMTRGGNYCSYAEACRSASRCSEASAYHTTVIGLRVAMSVEAVRQSLMESKQTNAPNAEVDLLNSEQVSIVQLESCDW
jgi:serine/threonine protein kinase/formylglycine-generating enzyme required for sulfatase activity